MRINDYKINSNNEINMGINNFLGDNGNFYETHLDKMDNISDIYLKLDNINYGLNNN